MNKFYIITLAVCAALNADAASRGQLAADFGRTLPAVRNELRMPPAVATAQAVEKAPAATTVGEFVGKYTWSYIGALNNNQGDNVEEVEFTIVDEATGEISIPVLKDYSVKATVDLEAGTLSIPNPQYLFSDSYGSVYFYLKDATVQELSKGKSERMASVGVIEGSTIVFPELDVWAVGDWKNEDLGFFQLCYDNSYEKLAEGEGEMNWTDCCTAVFHDGWSIPAFGMSPSNFPWQVTVQRNIKEDGLYRIHNPYLESGCQLPQQYLGNGDIVFSLADPECVTVMPGYLSGFNDGVGRLYYFNVEGSLASVGMNSEGILAALMAEGAQPSTYENGTAVIRNCVFDDTKACTHYYTWQDGEGRDQSDLMVAKLMFDAEPTGIDVIDGSATQGEAVYYNLQGVRVANPANGVYIRRQGNTTIKVVVR